MKIEEQENFYNKAALSSEEEKVYRYENDNCCGDPLIFAMQDKHHKFSMGLFTILECLRIAENEGQVPKLPDSWWISIENRFSPEINLPE